MVDEPAGEVEPAAHGAGAVGGGDDPGDGVGDVDSAIVDGGEAKPTVERSMGVGADPFDTLDVDADPASTGRDPFDPFDAYDGAVAPEGAFSGWSDSPARQAAIASPPISVPRPRPAFRPGTLAFGMAFLVIGVLGLLEPLDVDFEPAWLWAVAPVALGLATMIAVIRRTLGPNG